MSSMSTRTNRGHGTVDGLLSTRLETCENDCNDVKPNAKMGCGEVGGPFHDG